MREHHAFGLARRPGGVHEDGEIGRLDRGDVPGWGSGRFQGTQPVRPVVVEDDDLDLRADPSTEQSGSRLRVDEDESTLAVAYDERDLVERLGREDRDDDAPRIQDSEIGDDPVDAV